jgi:predicted SprT family Zn-dependent metalloprotease
MLQMASLAESVNSGDAQTAHALALPQHIDRGVYTPTPTEQTYVLLLTAFTHFNRDLFAGALPDCLITLQRRAGTYGYFSSNKFAAIDGDALAHEIALNPAHFRTCPPKDVASTLVHEMVHLWQERYGKPPRSGYHDREWATAMRRIGLQPFSNSDPDKETGYSIDHRIIEGGPFDLSYQAFEATGETLRWGDAFPPNDEKRKRKRETFVCPRCDQKVLGVPKTRVRCDLCDLVMAVRHKGETADVTVVADTDAGGEQ